MNKLFFFFHFAQLLMVGASVVRCVQAAQRHGPVVIVTESDENWVRGTAELLLPGSSASCLKNVEIVSSRERFGADFPGQPACWHIASFSYVTNRHLLSAAAAVVAAAAAGAPASVGTATAEKFEEGEAEMGGGGVLRGAEAGAEAEAGAGLREQGSGNTGAIIADDADGAAGVGVPLPRTPPATASDGDVAAERGLGTVVAVATAPRAWQDKSATRTLREHHPKIVAKTVSLIKCPSPLELRNQLDLLSESFDLLFGFRTPGRAPMPGARGPGSCSGPTPFCSVRLDSGAAKISPQNKKGILTCGRGVIENGDGGGGGMFDDYATPTTTSSTGRSFDEDGGKYFDDEATVISSSSGRSVDGDAVSPIRGYGGEEADRCDAGGGGGAAVAAGAERIRSPSALASVGQ